MENEDWLLLLSKDKTVESVVGGAPTSWVGRRIDDCAGLPEPVRSAAHRLVENLSSALVHRVRLTPDQPGAPSFTLLTVEAILVRPADVALEPLLRKALEPLRLQAEEADISLRLESSGDLPAQVSLDAHKLAWAVSTLVGNALRYVRRGTRTMPGGNVAVRLTHNAAARMLSITVEDDGPGIPASVQPWLFEPNPATGQSAALSLHLVRDVAAAHGGGMVIKSSTSAENRGTAITLWIPAPASDA